MQDVPNVMTITSETPTFLEDLALCATAAGTGAPKRKEIVTRRAENVCNAYLTLRGTIASTANQDIMGMPWVSDVLYANVILWVHKILQLIAVLMLENITVIDLPGSVTVYQMWKEKNVTSKRLIIISIPNQN